MAEAAELGMREGDVEERWFVDRMVAGRDGMELLRIGEVG